MIRKNDEHWKDNLLGLRFNPQLEEAINKRHSVDIKELSGRSISEACFVAAVNPKDNKILDIGFNCPNDLILDNFGKWLASFIRQPAASDLTATFTDIDNSSQTFCIYSRGTTTVFTSYNGLTGTQIQLGSGSTAAARGNYAIETALGTAPENTRFSTGAGSYAGGSISFSGAVSAGGAGTVNEMGFFGYWLNTSAALKTVMLFHDILSSGVAFIAGNTLNASYSITL